MVEIVALAGALTDAREHGITAVRLGNIVDELRDDDGLADAGATEGADLAATHEGADQVDDLDAGLKDRGFHVLLDERRGRAMDGVAFLVHDRAPVVDGVAGDVDDAAEHAVSDRHGDGSAGIDDRHAPDQTFGGGHGDGADNALAEVLLHFQREFFRPAGGAELDGERLVDGRDVLRGKLDVDHRADDLDDFAGVH